MKNFAREWLAPFLGVLLGLAVIRCVSAEPSTPTDFESMNEAAVNALQLSYRLTPAYEQGGVVTRLSNGRFAIGSPHTDYAGDTVEIDADPELYQGMVVATYHTHPCLPVTHVPGMFSPPDLRGAREEKLGSYIADLCTGDVHYWQPGDGYSALPMSPDHPAVLAVFGPQVAFGKIVGHIQVSGEPQELLPHRPAGESWDQENLKKNDRGCPTAIFVAPGGTLVECP